MVFQDLGHDTRLAFRSIARAPAFAAGVVASLTLGIVANTVAFSFMNAAVFRPFPGVRDQHELVRVAVLRSERHGYETSTSYEEYEALRASLTGLERFAAHYRVEFAGMFRREPSILTGALVSSHYFDVLGVRPAAGRFFLPHEDQAAHAVAVIGHGTWRRLFDEDPAAVGQTIIVNGTSLEIVGVAPPHFYGTHKGTFHTDVWVPSGMAHLALRDASRRPVAFRSAGYLPLTYVGRRRPGTTLAQVQAEAVAAGHQINAMRPADRQGSVVSIRRVWLNDPAQNAPAVLAFMMVPLLVLVIACVNAANLLLARSSRQSRDWQMRLALGASRWRIVRQVLAESVLLALLAAAVGLTFTKWVLDLVAHTVPVPIPLDARVQLFTIAAAAATSIAFGLGPALHVASKAASDPRGLSQLAAGASRSRVRFALIAVQAALSLGLLATGAQWIKTVRSGYGGAETPGADRLLIASFNVDPLNMQREAADDFYARLLEHTASLPGVVAAAFTTASLAAGPIESDSSVRTWLPHQAPTEGQVRPAARVSANFFKAAGVPVVQGRALTSAEHVQPLRTVIVNGAFAKRYLESNALNHILRIAPSKGTYGEAVEATVVGVVGSEIGRGDDTDVPMLYYAAPIKDAPARMLYVRFDESGQFNLASLQSNVRQVDDRVPIRDARTLRERREGSHMERRLIANGVVILGLFALTLAAGGLLGVVSYLVALRRREIGVRLALGASGRSVVGLIVRQALAPTVVGALVGAGGAAAIGLIVRSRLYGAAPVDPIAFGAATGLLVVTMAIASVLPARQAARVDPLVVLKED